MKGALTLYGYKKSKIESKVYKRPPKGCPRHDIIRLTCTHQDGHNFADFFVYPEEAMMIATALMRAWMVTYQQGMQNINPNNSLFYKPFMELEGMPMDKESIKIRKVFGQIGMDIKHGKENDAEERQEERENE